MPAQGRKIPTGIRLSPELDLTQIDIHSGPYIADVEAGVQIRLVGLNRDLPMSGIDRPQNIFPVDIHHFNRISALNGPNSVGAIGGRGANVERRGL